MKGTRESVFARKASFCARFVLAERKVLLVSREKDIIDVASRAHSNRQ